MRIFKDDTEYQGSPQELADFFKLNSAEPDAAQPGFTSEDFQPLHDIVGESEALRRKLAEDPSYNPFGGVIPSPESEITDPDPAVGFAEEDTGVSISD